MAPLFATRGTASEAIFVGYRRNDTGDAAGRIYDAMAQRFGKTRIFKDVDNIGPGVDFGDYIKTVLPRCRVALVLIGPHWLDSRDETGKRRLDDVNDWVRIEIETALLTRGVYVVPVLVNGARMPHKDEVPESLRPVLRRNAAIIRPDPDFHADVKRLVTAIRASLNTGVLDLSKIGGKASPSGPHARKGGNTPLQIGSAIVAALALVAIGFGASRWLPIGSAVTAGQQTATTLPAPTSAESMSIVSLEQTRPQQPVQERQKALPTSQSASRFVQTFRDCPDCPEMVRIPSRSFAEGRYEVTFAQWDACVAADGCNGYRPNDGGWGRGNRPVINVNWNDAQAYVRWLSQRTGQRYRLLTSAEWEFAARAGTTTIHSWGDQDPICDAGAGNGANFSACADDRTRPVGSFQPNAFGLYDVHGNVWEWVEDCHDSSCSDRVLRGGSWFSIPELLRSATSYWTNPDLRYNFAGFRVARAL